MKKPTKTILDFAGVVKAPPGLPKDWDELRKLSRDRAMEKKFGEFLKKKPAASDKGDSSDSGGAGTPSHGE